MELTRSRNQATGPYIDQYGYNQATGPYGDGYGYNQSTNQSYVGVPVQYYPDQTGSNVLPTQADTSYDEVQNLYKTFVNQDQNIDLQAPNADLQAQYIELLKQYYLEQANANMYSAQAYTSYGALEPAYQTMENQYQYTGAPATTSYSYPYPEQPSPNNFSAQANIPDKQLETTNQALMDQSEYAVVPTTASYPYPEQPSSNSFSVQAYIPAKQLETTNQTLMDQSEYAVVSATASHFPEQHSYYYSEQSSPSTEQLSPSTERASSYPEQSSLHPERASSYPQQPSPSSERASSYPEQPSPSTERASSYRRQPSPSPEEHIFHPEQSRPYPERPQPCGHSRPPQPPTLRSAEDLVETVPNDGSSLAILHRQYNAQDQSLNASSEVIIPSTETHIPAASSNANSRGRGFARNRVPHVSRGTSSSPIVIDEGLPLDESARDSERRKNLPPVNKLADTGSKTKRITTPRWDILFIGTLSIMAKDWSGDEFAVLRRVVEFHRSPIKNVVATTFRPCDPEELLEKPPDNVKRISCIWSTGYGGAYVTFTDTMFLLEYLLEAKFSNKGKAHIRAILNYLDSIAIPGGKEDGTGFYERIKSYNNPRPYHLKCSGGRIKLFPWCMLSHALIKVASRMEYRR